MRDHVGAGVGLIRRQWRQACAGIGGDEGREGGGEPVVAHDLLVLGNRWPLELRSIGTFLDDILHDR